MLIDRCDRARPGRRRFLADAARGVALFLAIPGAVSAQETRRLLVPRVHPDPRPGIDGSRVLTREQVSPRVADLFDGIRGIPHVVDGIACHCGCGFIQGMRSLLSCYEGVGMAQGCHICEGEGRLAVRLEREGAPLDQIRAAIDRAY
ncbi:MAG: PCYCGC domain-containing protein, partial [Gemmatimonadota bacterium]|nr:PCYCGC domain-containing protein [Gemmatimonadota bacterium]